MSFVQFFMHIFSKNSGFSEIRTSFMRNELEVKAFLNLLSENTDGRRNLNAWLRDTKYAEKLICEDIYKEMDTVRKDMALRMRDVNEEKVLNFNFNKDIAEILQVKVPTLSAVLHSAAQTKRAAIENKIKVSDIVRFSP